MSLKRGAQIGDVPVECGAVKDVVERQIEAGIDIVDDGEMGKASWITYLYERVSGLEARVMNVEGASMMPPSRDRQQFPGAYADLDALDDRCHGAIIRRAKRKMTVGAGTVHSMDKEGQVVSFPLDRVAHGRSSGG